MWHLKLYPSISSVMVVAFLLLMMSVICTLPANGFRQFVAPIGKLRSHHHSLLFLTHQNVSRNSGYRRIRWDVTKESLVTHPSSPLLHAPSSSSRYPSHQCQDDELELREDRAGVVFTGTVERLLYPKARRRIRVNRLGLKQRIIHRSRTYKGVIRIKRVMKGLSDVLSNVVVVVSGFGNPHICHSHVKEKDTRIFLLSQTPNGDFKLNSSLVRVTLKNLLRTEAAIKGKRNDIFNFMRI